MSWSRIPLRALLPGPTPIPLWALLLSTLCPFAAAAESARIVPSDGLAVYVESDGLDAHAEAWKATAAYAMFERTPAGAMTADIARQVVDRLLRSLPDPRPSGAELLSLQQQVRRRGFSLGLLEEADHGASCVVVLNGLGTQEARERVGRLVRTATRPGEKADADPAVVSRLRGRDIFQFKDRAAARADGAAPGTPEAPKGTAKSPTDALAWWFEGDDLVIVAGPPASKADGVKHEDAGPLPSRVASVIDVIEEKAPSVLGHPGRAAAQAEGRDVKGFESEGLVFVEADKAQRLSSRLAERIDRAAAPYEGPTLPSAKYITDDVKFLAPAPTTGIPGANSQGPKRDASAKGVDSAEPLPKVEATLPHVPMLRPLPVAGRDEPAVPIAGPHAGGKTQDPGNAARALLGLDGITRIVGRWGFQGRAFLTAVRVEAPAPRRGLAGVLDQAGFRKDRLPPIPQGAREVLIGSLDTVKAYETVLDAGSKNLGGDAVADQEISRLADLFVFEATGQRIREDLLGHFGSTWYLYSEPGHAEDATDTGMPILLVEVDDPKGLGKVLDSLAKRINAYLGVPKLANDGKVVEGPPVIALEPLPAPDRGYRLNSPAGVIPWLGEGRQPTIQIGEAYVAVAASPALARAALATASRPEGRWSPSGEVAEAFKCLPAELTSLTVGDPEDSSWPELVANLPRLVQHMATSFETTEDDRPGSGPASKVLGLLGVPRSDGFRLRIDPAVVPKAEALTAQLFPSVLATAVDDRGIRFISREALPFACAGPRFRYSASTTNGEALAVDLSPFLFPCFRAGIKHHLNKPGVAFTFGMKGKFATGAKDDD